MLVSATDIKQEPTSPLAASVNCFIFHVLSGPKCTANLYCICYFAMVGSVYFFESLIWIRVKPTRIHNPACIMYCAVSIRPSIKFSNQPRSYIWPDILYSVGYAVSGRKSNLISGLAPRLYFRWLDNRPI